MLAYFHETSHVTKGNRMLVAKLLGIGRTTLYNKIEAYGIE